MHLEGEVIPKAKETDVIMVVEEYFCVNYGNYIDAGAFDSEFNRVDYVFVALTKDLYLGLPVTKITSIVEYF